MSADTELAEIAREVKACKLCKLHQGAKQGVPGEGPATAEIMYAPLDLRLEDMLVTSIDLSA